MITKNQGNNRLQQQILCIEDLVPKNHILRDIERAIDFSFIYDLVSDLYCEHNGRPSIDPVVLFKIVLYNTFSELEVCGKRFEKSK